MPFLTISECEKLKCQAMTTKCMNEGADIESAGQGMNQVCYEWMNANPCSGPLVLWCEEVFCLSEHNLIAERKLEVGIKCLHLTMLTNDDEEASLFKGGLYPLSREKYWTSRWKPTCSLYSESNSVLYITLTHTQ